jgi:hypothetical protein
LGSATTVTARTHTHTSLTPQADVFLAHSTFVFYKAKSIPQVNGSSPILRFVHLFSASFLAFTIYLFTVALRLQLFEAACYHLDDMMQTISLYHFLLGHICVISGTTVQTLRQVKQVLINDFFLDLECDSSVSLIVEALLNYPGVIDIVWENSTTSSKFMGKDFGVLVKVR